MSADRTKSQNQKISWSLSEMSPKREEERCFFVFLCRDVTVSYPSPPFSHQLAPERVSQRKRLHKLQISVSSEAVNENSSSAHRQWRRGWGVSFFSFSLPIIFSTSLPVQCYHRNGAKGRSSSSLNKTMSLRAVCVFPFKMALSRRQEGERTNLSVCVCSVCVCVCLVRLLRDSWISHDRLTDAWGDVKHMHTHTHTLTDMHA